MTDNGAGFLDILNGRSIVAILRGLEPSRAIEIAERVWDRQIGIVEVPVQDAPSFEAFQIINRLGRERGEKVGAGTITDLTLLHRVIDAGAFFTVAPGLDLEILEASELAGVPHLPGVATASEVHVALRAGCDVTKAFPASSLSPSWMREMRGPFPQMGYVATGGVNTENAPLFLAAGALAVGVGSALHSPSQAAAFFDAIEDVASQGTTPTQ